MYTLRVESRYEVKTTYLEKSKCLIIWNGWNSYFATAWFTHHYILVIQLNTCIFFSRSSCEPAQEISMEELAELIPIKHGMVHMPSVVFICASVELAFSLVSLSK